MSDTTTSGENAPVAPAETVGATPAQPPAATTEQAAPATTAPAFGSSRGSGLARGKRASNATNASQNAPAGEYKPTAIQVVTTAREYKNPFAPAEEPAAPEAAPVPQADTVAQVAQPAAPQAPVPAAEEAPSDDAAAQPETKAELNILPPEDKPRRAQSWESDSFAAEHGEQQQRAERPVFQPRGQNQGERNQQRREGRENRDRRDNRDNRESRPADGAQPAAKSHAPAPVPEKKESKGFFGWLKGLFSSSDDAAESKFSAGDRNNDRRNRDGGRRHRGGRNRGYRGEQRGGENRGSANPNAEGHPQGSQERRFDRGDRGDRNHRHRGGRNRHRGGHGGQRPEGGDSGNA